MEGSADFDLVAASLRADTEDLGVFAEALAMKFEGALPGRCRVERRGLRGRGPVQRLVVELGTSRYELLNDRGQISTRRSTVVRGIAVKNEDLGLDQWIDGLASEVVSEADRSGRGRVALEKLLDA